MGIFKTEEIYTDIIRPKTGSTLTILGLAQGNTSFVDPRSFGDIGGDALQAAINSVSTQSTIYLAPGTWSLTDDMEIPSYVNLAIEAGAVIYVPTGKALTIKGTIDAGPWKIFDWNGTGRFYFQESLTSNFYLPWWGALSGVSNDISAKLLKAYNSLEVVGPVATSTQKGGHNIVIPMGFWRLASPMEYVPEDGWTSTTFWLPTLLGEDQYASCILMDVGGSNDGIRIGGLYDGTSRWTGGTWIKNLCVPGTANGCRHAFNLQCWNSGGGMKDVSLECGSTSSAVYISSAENCYWDIKIGVGANRYSQGGAPYYNNMYAGLEATKLTGVGFAEGFGTYNYVKVHKTFQANEIFGIKISDSWGVNIDGATMEGCGGGEVQSYYTNGQAPVTAMYAGAITKVAQTFTLPTTTTIDNAYWQTQKTGNPLGPFTCSIYATSGGIPTTEIIKSWRVVNSREQNGGNCFSQYFPLNKISLAAGTYALVLEYSTGGDASNYLGVSQGWYGSFYPGTSTETTCYTWSGSSWTEQTYNLSHAINYRGAIWIYNSTRIKVGKMHYEGGSPALLIDYSRQIEVDGCEGALEVTRSKLIEVSSGGNSYYWVYVDPISWVDLGNSYVINTLTSYDTYGYVRFKGTSAGWSPGWNWQPGQIGNKDEQNLFHNTMLDRWKTDVPDGFIRTAGQTFTKCGDGQPDTTRHPMAPYCLKIVESSPTIDSFYVEVADELLEMLRGKWICYSFYLMIPAGQTFTNVLNIANSVTTPAWASGTSYEIGDVVNGTAFCCQPGTSGGSTPGWGAPAYFNWVVDGSVVWVESYNGSSQGIDTKLVGDGKWRRFGVNMFVSKNATLARFQHQWYAQAATTSTSYIAMPQINMGITPSAAPDPTAIAHFLKNKPVITGGLLISRDAYIPTDSNSKLYNKYSILGDVCYNDGSITALTAVNMWRCTASGVNGSSSTWVADPH